MDVLRKLGNANKEFSRPKQGSKSPLHFLNYLELGVDLGFSEITYSLKKIIMRSNQIADPIFGFYDRCFFELPIDQEEESKENLSSFDERAEIAKHVTPLNKFSEIKSHLQEDKQGGLFYDNNLHQESLFNNFTHFYAYPGLVVEVVPETDQIASIGLY